MAFGAGGFSPLARHDPHQTQTAQYAREMAALGITPTPSMMMAAGGAFPGGGLGGAGAPSLLPRGPPSAAVTRLRVYNPTPEIGAFAQRYAEALGPLLTVMPRGPTAGPPVLVDTVTGTQYQGPQVLASLQALVTEYMKNKRQAAAVSQAPASGSGAAATGAPPPWPAYSGGQAERGPPGPGASPPSIPAVMEGYWTPAASAQAVDASKASTLSTFGLVPEGGSAAPAPSGPGGQYQQQYDPFAASRDRSFARTDLQLAARDDLLVEMQRNEQAVRAAGQGVQYGAQGGDYQSMFQREGVRTRGQDLAHGLGGSDDVMRQAIQMGVLSQSADGGVGIDTDPTHAAPIIPGFTSFIEDKPQQNPYSILAGVGGAGSMRHGFSSLSNPQLAMAYSQSLLKPGDDFSIMRRELADPNLRRRAQANLEAAFGASGVADSSLRGRALPITSPFSAAEAAFGSNITRSQPKLSMEVINMMSQQREQREQQLARQYGGAPSASSSAGPYDFGSLADSGAGYASLFGGAASAVAGAPPPPPHAGYTGMGALPAFPTFGSQQQPTRPSSSLFGGSGAGVGLMF